MTEDREALRRLFNSRGFHSETPDDPLPDWLVKVVYFVLGMTALAFFVMFIVSVFLVINPGYLARF